MYLQEPPWWLVHHVALPFSCSLPVCTVILSSSKSTLIMTVVCKSRWHFGAGLANCAKRACTLLSIYCLMVKSCNTFGVATSPNVVDLSTSLPDNGMIPNTWSCPGIIISRHCVRWISGALNEHYLMFWAPNRALSAEKTRDAQSTKSKFFEH